MRSRRSVAAILLLLALGVGLHACATRTKPRPLQPPAVSRPDVVEQQPVLEGTVTRVVDGDTLEVQLSSGPIRVRLHSIDTPEWNQPWGAQAKAALASRVEAQRVTLDVVTQDQYDRLVAVVLLDDGNVNAWMVQQGHAWAYRQYLEDEQYCAWEGAARISRRGLWSQAPADWRAPWEWRAKEHGDLARFTDYSHETVANCIAAMRAAAPALHEHKPAPLLIPSSGAPADTCLIKGNISESGRIYHVPGSPWYDETVIDASRGERWFCTEADARAAGWRPAR
jgi:endonuclease YncB( thermonuclease family)